MSSLLRIFGTVEDTVESIDAEITRLQNLILQLRNRRNALSPLNQLPCELIREIMLHVKDDSMLGRLATYHFVKVAQICQHWRKIALDCSMLWTTLVTPPAGVWWLKELFRRSGSAPISRVDVHSNWNLRRLSTHAAQELAILLPSQMHRIQALRLEVDETMERTLLPHLHIPAPSLERLCISGNANQPVLPTNLWGGSLPKLQFLCLQWCSFASDAPYFTTTLRDLRIDFPGSRLQLTELRHLLSLPNLRNLELHEALPTIPPQPWNNLTFGHGPIQLPSLQTLSISEWECNYSVHFLTQICFPSNLRLTLDTGNSKPTKFVNQVAYPILTTGPAMSHFNSGFGLHLQDRSDHTLHFTFVTPRNNIVWLDFMTNYDPDNLIELKRGYKAYCAMLERLPLENLQEFTLAGDVRIQETTFQKLSQCPNIGAINLEFEATEEGVVDFVGSLVDEIPQCDTHKRKRPSLRTFEYEDSDIETEDEDGTTTNGSSGKENDKGVDGSQGSGLADQELAVNVHGSNDLMSTRCARDGQEGLYPDSSSDNYTPLEDKVKPCSECERLGKSFFPALRRLALYGVDLTEWWVVNEDHERLHPIAEFIVRRINCGLVLEEIRFDPTIFYDDSAESDVQKMLQDLCGEFSPSIIRVVHPADIGSLDMED